MKNKNNIYFVCNEIAFEDFIDELYPHILDLFSLDEVEKRVENHFNLRFLKDKESNTVTFEKKERFYMHKSKLDMLENAKEYVERQINEGIYD